MAHYALGHAFNSEQLVETLDITKLHFNTTFCKQLTGHTRRRELSSFIFRTTLFLIIDDIIEEGINFKCPGCRLPTYMYMKRITGNAFKQARQKGKWFDVDLLESNFSSAMLVFDSQKKGFRRTRNIYLDTNRRDKIIEKVNSGFVYTNINEREVDYYIPIIMEKFPGISKKDINYILSECFKLLYLHIVYGTDVVLKMSTPNSFAYFGFLTTNSMVFYTYYSKKLYKKLLYTIKKRKIPHGEYFYFTLTDTQYEEYIKIKSEHPRQKIFSFENIMMYAHKDLCYVKQRQYKYFFKVKYKYEFNTIFFTNVKLKNIELYCIKPPCKFKDILVDNYEYENI